MDNKQYNTISDFLEDDSFKHWVHHKNATDVNFWEFWVSNNPDKKNVVEEAKNIVLGISFNQSFVDQKKVTLEWNKLEANIKTKNKPVKRKIPSLKQFSIAATIVVLISTGLYFINDNKRITHTTDYGEILNIKLQDGSDVTLNSNSSISYYKDNSRKVWLSGEAFFQVDKKIATKAKFWVITKDLLVEVYGTSFNVNSKNKKTAVFLEEGNIWLSLKNGENKKMTPGNYISYSAKDDKILENKNIFDASSKTSWKNGSLIFQGLSLEKAMKKIEESYGYSIIFKDNKSKQTLITGAVPLTNIDICIKAIEKSTNVIIIKSNNSLVISKE